MKRITLLAILLVATACDQGGVSEYQVVSSSDLRIVNAGEAPPAECAAVGTVVVPQRKAGVLARMFGFAEEEFYRPLHAQIAPLKANLLIPSEGSDPITAASSGTSFRATAYSCP